MSKKIITHNSSHLKFGVLGVGRYGKKILSKLEEIGTVIWAVNSDSDFEELEIPDWVFIITPNILHYEQAKYFLVSGANVFVEKPATLDLTALEDLINLSKVNDRSFYIDDVFLYRKDIHLDNLNELGGRFSWHKKFSTQDGSLLDRFAYHHFYMLYKALGGEFDFEITSFDSFELKKLKFEAKINNRKYRFSYSISEDGKSNHVAFGKNIGRASNDALWDMLSAVINGKVSLDKNHKMALWNTKQISKIKELLFPNIGIVGGGIFGSTFAIELANQGYNVTLYERQKSLLAEASSINQYRVHEGYHYPRSIITAKECHNSASSFIKSYKQAIIPKSYGIKHHYAIASKKSMTNSHEFIDFMETIGLQYKKTKPIQSSDLMVEVEENIFDPEKLISIVKNRLRGAGVKLQLGKVATEDDLKDFDFSIIATYANLNDWCEKKREYQFEIIEKPVLKLPSIYNMKSIVVMDGPFMCIDPLGSTDMHVMGNVVHAIHHTNVGFHPIIPDGYEDLLNKGIIKKPPITNIEKFIESASKFFPNIKQAQHIGSMYTIRTVLPHREKDDARPSQVEWIGNNRLQIFSGKICTCVSIAKTGLKFIESQINKSGLTNSSTKHKHLEGFKE